MRVSSTTCRKRVTSEVSGAMMDLTINGEAKQVQAGLSVAELLDMLELNARKVAVERNLEIVSKSAYEATQLETGDRIEIVAFVGGG